MAGRNEETMVTNLPRININRSTFGSKSHRHLMTANAGDLNIFYAEEYLPGDTCKINLASLIRELTPIHPTMDNLYCDIYFFSCPDRLNWVHWKNFMGENDSSYWEQETEYEIPQVTAPPTGWVKGSLADQLGIRQGVSGVSIDARFLRTYCRIFNDWFRDENLVEPLNNPTDDTTVSGSNGTDQTVDCVKGGMPAKVAKLHDVFTSALPEPQKGPDTIIPLGESAPIITNDKGTVWSSETVNQITAGQKVGIGTTSNGTDPYNTVAYNTETGTFLTGQNGLRASAASLQADLENAQAATVNQLRQAFAVQRMYERDARGGTRYTELIRSHFNVLSPDARQQRPEYLGGKRISLQTMEVIQTSSTDETSPQGNTAGMSKTIDSDYMFESSFTEHGIIMGLFCIRNENSYSQGIERKFLRKTKLDFYWPALAHIGEVGIKNIELYAQGTTEDNEIFGYQEKDYEYRYSKNLITGEFSPDYAQSLDSWHYGDDYSELPTLSQEWIQSDRSNVDRTIAVTGQDQFLCDFYFDEVWTRPIPMHGVPGMIDHY